MLLFQMGPERSHTQQSKACIVLYVIQGYEVGVKCEYVKMGDGGFKLNLDKQ